MTKAGNKDMGHKPKKKKRGRPRKFGDQPVKVFTLRMAEDHLESLKETSEMRGVSVNDYILSKVSSRQLAQDKVWFIEYQSQDDIVTDYFSHYGYEKALKLLDESEDFVVINSGPYRMPPVEDFRQWRSMMGFDEEE